MEELLLKNRIDFMYFFDVRDGNPNEIPMLVICHVLMQKQAGFGDGCLSEA